MNYGRWLLIGQSVQTSIMAGQMRQLGQIQGELAMQRLSQQYQAILDQVLFETEQAAHYVTGLAMHDRFAAGIHARLRLNAVEGIHPGLFSRYETKRAWAASIDQLSVLWRAVDCDPAMCTPARNVVQAIETMRQWQAFIGDPAAMLAAANRAVETSQKSANGWLVASIIGLFLYIVPGVVMAIVGLIPARTRLKVARRDLETAKKQHAAFSEFVASPSGGQLLDLVSKDHPALAA